MQPQGSKRLNSSCSESSSPLGDVRSLRNGAGGVAHSLLVDALLVYALDRRVDALDRLVCEGVPTEGQLEVVRGDRKHIVDGLESGVVDLVEANVEVLELRVDQQEPVGDLSARIVPTHFRLKAVEERHDLFRLL